MNELPQIKLEIENKKSNALIIGQYSALGQVLKELLAIRGLMVNDSSEADYLFQLGEFEKAAFFLEKAQKSGAKYFLLYNLNAEDKAGRKALKITSEKIQAKKISGKIIQYAGFEGRELELCQKTLTNCFKQTKEETIVLKGPGEFFAKEAEQGLEKENKPKKNFLKYFFLFLFALFILTLPLTLIFLNLFLGGWGLEQSYQAALKANFLQARMAALGSEQNFKTAFLMTKFFSGPLKTEKFTRLLEAGENLSRGAGYLAEAAGEGQKLGTTIFNQEQTDLNESLTKIKLAISSGEEEFAKVEAQKLELPFLQKKIDKAMAVRQKLIKIKNFLPNFPWVLGFDNPRTYLVLMQNNFELRPGGGFIGTIGFLTFNEGKAEFKIQDVYTVDGQLTGHVEPPKPIRDYLNQPHWYLRDSNFDPDFTVNAEKALWFLEKELGVNLDGVISVDLSVFQKILEVTGPLEVLDYQEKISADNFFLKTQAHVNEQFFPGSTAKKDFLGGVAQTLFNQLSSNKSSSFALSQILFSSFDERHLMLFWQNPQVEEVTLQQGWGGEVRENATMQQCNNPIMCLNDYLMVVDANLGVNKVNYFVKRKIKKEINLGQNELTSKVTIDYENTSPQGSSFGGVYKNYLRVLTNKDWILENILVDGQRVDLSKGIDQEEIRGKKSTGFLIEIPALTKKEVVLNYQRNISVSDREFVYNLLVQKQAGTDRDSLRLVSNFGLSYNERSELIEDNSVSPIYLRYNGDLLTDKQFQIQLNK